jgi:hypothetical protein
MPATAEEIRAAIEERFAQVARSPEQEQKFPVSPASARKLGYDTSEIGTLPASGTESFCVGNPLGLGETPAVVLRVARLQGVHPAGSRQAAFRSVGVILPITGPRPRW